MTICFQTDAWKIMWPAIVAIPSSAIVALLMIELGKHIYLSFVLKTDYYEPQKYSFEKPQESSEEKTLYNNINQMYK